MQIEKCKVQNEKMKNKREDLSNRLLSFGNNSRESAEVIFQFAFFNLHFSLSAILDLEEEAWLAPTLIVLLESAGICS